MSPFNVVRNDWYANPKSATIHTPPGLARLLFEILAEHIEPGVVLDPSVGAGALLAPWIEAGWQTLGIDIEEQGHPDTIVRDFLDVVPGEYPRPSLVLANPPFNVDDKTRATVRGFARRPMMPELWLARFLDLWGMDTPIVLFVPYYFRQGCSARSAPGAIRRSSPPSRSRSTPSTASWCPPRSSCSASMA